jgi:hypothetical protein
MESWDGEIIEVQAKWRLQRCVMPCTRMIMTEETAFHHKNNKSRYTRKFCTRTFCVRIFHAKMSWLKMIFDILFPTENVH